MKPAWENTFNGELKFWGNIGYALNHAIKCGYKFLLWTDGRIYEASYYGWGTQWTKADLYR